MHDQMLLLKANSVVFQSENITDTQATNATQNNNTLLITSITPTLKETVTTQDTLETISDKNLIIDLLAGNVSDISTNWTNIGNNFTTELSVDHKDGSFWWTLTACLIILFSMALAMIVCAIYNYWPPEIPYFKKKEENEMDEIEA